MLNYPSLGDTIFLDWELGALDHMYLEWSLCVVEQIGVREGVMTQVSLTTIVLTKV